MTNLNLDFGDNFPEFKNCKCLKCHLRRQVLAWYKRTDEPYEVKDVIEAISKLLAYAAGCSEPAAESIKILIMIEYPNRSSKELH